MTKLGVLLIALAIGETGFAEDLSGRFGPGGLAAVTVSKTKDELNKDSHNDDLEMLREFVRPGSPEQKSLLENIFNCVNGLLFSTTTTLTSANSKNHYQVLLATGNDGKTQSVKFFLSQQYMVTKSMPPNYATAVKGNLSPADFEAGKLADGPTFFQRLKGKGATADPIFYGINEKGEVEKQKGKGSLNAPKVSPDNQDFIATQLRSLNNFFSHRGSRFPDTNAFSTCKKLENQVDQLKGRFQGEDSPLGSVISSLSKGMASFENDVIQENANGAKGPSGAGTDGSSPLPASSPLSSPKPSATPAVH